MAEFNWETQGKCPFCHAKYTASIDNIRYGDLRQEFMFVPDMQYFLVCSSCNYNIILNDIPSNVSLVIQNRNTQ